MNWQSAKSTMLRMLVEKPRLGLITDVDGTISPIVNKPEAAQVTARSRELLQVLQAQLTLVAVVSGRAVADVRQRVNVPGLVYVGNHGLERWVDGRVEVPAEVRRFRPVLESAMAAVGAHEQPGMQIEDKMATISIHYRQTHDPQQAAETLGPLIRAISAQHGLRFFQGRMVFELRPPIEVNKGTAFSDLITDYALDAAVYLGDDTTDVDALRMARQLRADGICYSVGAGVESDDMPTPVRETADLLVPGVAGVESFLEWLTSARQASSI